jgi:dihydrofolate reductase
MAKLSVFNSLTLDGYFTDPKGDISWAHSVPQDKEWVDFVSGNAGGTGPLLFGRVTYEMMQAFWPTPAAAKQMPEVAEGMNRLPKFVFSRSLTESTWQNTTIVKGDLVAEVRRMKKELADDITILGSGSIVAQLTQAGLIDDFQFVIVPVILGAGRTMFDGVTGQPKLKPTKTRAFNNGNVVLWYERP